MDGSGNGNKGIIEMHTKSTGKDMYLSDEGLQGYKTLANESRYCVFFWFCLFAIFVLLV